MLTAEYVQFCRQNSRSWEDKTPCLGDMYVDWKRETLDAISQDTLGQIEYRSGRYTYLPSVDDLLELIDNQIRAWGDDPTNTSLRITFDPQKKWCAEIRYAGRITLASGQRSLEELLYRGMTQMVYFDPGIPVTRKSQ